MSLLKTIKGTLKNVQEDISGSLKSLTVSPEKPNIQEVFHYGPLQVNYDAGAEILNRDEHVWKDLYQFTEDTANKAQDVDIQIGNLYIYYDRQSETLMKFHEEASRLPTLINQLQEITDSLAMVEEEYDKVEAALVHLENVCEEQEFQRNVISHHKQLAVYKMKKEHELQKYRVQLAREHAKKVEQANKKREHLLHEKQAAFGEQFVQDVEYFKKHGKPGRLPSTPESEKKLDLAEITVDEDTDALDAFLATDGESPNTETKEISDDDESEGPQVEIIPEITSPSETNQSVCAEENSENQSVENASNPTNTHENQSGSSKEGNHPVTETGSETKTVSQEESLALASDNQSNIPQQLEKQE